jgi:hypothetical protein
MSGIWLTGMSGTGVRVRPWIEKPSMPPKYSGAGTVSEDAAESLPDPDGFHYRPFLRAFPAGRFRRMPAKIEWLR